MRFLRHLRDQVGQRDIVRDSDNIGARTMTLCAEISRSS